MQSNPKRTYVRITYKQRRIDVDYFKHENSMLKGLLSSYNSSLQIYNMVGIKTTGFTIVIILIKERIT